MGDESEAVPTTIDIPNDGNELAFPLIPLWKGIQVGVSFALKKLESIDTQAQSFSADLVIQLRVRDNRDVLEQEQVKFRHPDQLRLFSAVEIENLLELVSPKELWTSRGVDNLFLYNMRVRGTFSTPFDLRAFPRDAQTLKVSLKSRVPIDVLEFVPADTLDESCAGNARVTLDDVGFKLEDTWDLGVDDKTAVRLQVGLTRPDESLSRLQYARAHLETMVIRKPATVDGLALLAVLFSVVAASSAVLLTSAEHASDRLALCATLLVTSQAFRDAISALLPAVAYETRFSRLINRITVLLALLTFDALLCLAQVSSLSVSMLGTFRFRSFVFALFPILSALEYFLTTPTPLDLPMAVLFPGIALLQQLIFASTSSHRPIHRSESSLLPVSSTPATFKLARADSTVSSAPLRPNNYFLRFRVNRSGHTVAEIFRGSSDEDSSVLASRSDTTQSNLQRTPTPRRSRRIKKTE